MIGNNREIPHCSFCGKSQKQAKKLIAGPEVYICVECVDLCNEIIATELPDHHKQQDRQVTDPPTPGEIHDSLNKHVVGQSNAKRVLSVAVYNHYKRIRLEDDGSDIELQKSNILLIGPPGCGKTLLAQTLARILEVPFTIVDATTLTEAGYVGDDAENILLRLVQAADHDVKKAETGIIYIDEIDKIARKNEVSTTVRDVSGEGAQQSLLKILEGTSVLLSPQSKNKHTQQESIHIDTTNILFICGGAFMGIEKIIERRFGMNTMGFGAEILTLTERETEQTMAQVAPEDLTKFGFIPEFVGRLPVVGTVDDLDQASLVRILTEPQNALIKQYQKIFRFENVDLHFTPEALEAIAVEAYKRATGARALRSVLEEVLLDTMYDLPNHRADTTVLIDSAEVYRNVNTTLRPRSLRGKPNPGHTKPENSRMTANRSHKNR